MSEVRPIERPVAGLKLHALQRGSGPPLVVAHHSIGSMGWGPPWEELSGDFGVYLPDLPGYGASEVPQWARSPRDQAILLGLFLDAEGLAPASIVGLGYGGWLAVELATLSPARLDKLVLVGAAGLLPEEGRILDQFLISHLDYARAYFRDMSRYEAVFGKEPDINLLIQWEMSREMTTRVAWKPYMYNRRLVPLLPEIDIPTLLIWGEHDAVVPREVGEKYASLLPNARLEIVSDCGHAVDLERPDRLAKLVRDHLAS